MSAINPSNPVEGAATTVSVRDNFLAAKNEIDALQAATGTLQAEMVAQQAATGTLQSEIEALQANATLVWHDVTFESGWVNYGSPLSNVHYTKDEKKIVRLRGVAKNGTMGNAIFTLPIGFRPAAAEIFAIASNGAFGYAQVNNNGQVVASSGSNTWFSLSGITFQAE